MYGVTLLVWEGKRSTESPSERNTYFFIIIFPYINMPTPVLLIIKVTVKEKVGSTLYLSRINSRKLSSLQEELVSKVEKMRQAILEGINLSRPPPPPPPLPPPAFLPPAMMPPFYPMPPLYPPRPMGGMPPHHPHHPHHPAQHRPRGFPGMPLFEISSFSSFPTSSLFLIVCCKQNT